MNTTEIKSTLLSTMSDYKGVSEEYVKLAKELELKKMDVIDPSVRDSAEKQMIKASKDNKFLANLLVKVDELRRERDTLSTLLSSYKSLIELEKVLVERG